MGKSNSNSNDEFQRVHERLIILDTKLDTLLDHQTKFVTKQESNRKTIILACWTLLASGLAKFQDIIHFFK
jgi:hypothetical protein